MRSCHALRLFALVLLAAFLAVRLEPQRAEAHGVPDQTLLGNPGCVAGVLRATASNGTLPKQEFVPAASDVSGIDVCLTLTGSSNVVINLRSGTAAAPGPILATGSFAAGAQTNWIHIEFPAPVTVTPGITYVIEATSGGGSPFTWRGTCGAIAGDCTSIDTPDRYPAGVSSAGPVVADFAFRTYAAQDNDIDGVNDGSDNCPFVANSDQANHDGTVDLDAVGKVFDDVTWPNSDASGDACDDDDDNDGYTDAQENAGPCGAPTSPILRDTDGDRAIDTAECALGSDPNNALSFPPLTLPQLDDTDRDSLSNAFEVTIGTSPTVADTDGDRVLDGVEYKYYATEPVFFANTDLDACSDAKEIASINADLTVSAIDMSQLAQHFGLGTTPKYIVHFDTNRDFNISAIDLSFVAQHFGPCV